MQRRHFLTLAAALPFASRARAADLPELKLGVVQYGTVQWVAETIRRNGLDTAHGFRLAPQTLANTEAGRVAILAGSADVVVSDWPFVAARRAAGMKLSFAPFSTASGAIITKPDAGITKLADLGGKRLGIAGGPADKSWLLVQAAAKQTGIDLAASAKLAYGAPPLLAAKLKQGELDGVLTFWNFAARLEADGFLPAITVEACAHALGLPARPSLVGYVFKEEWANGSAGLADRFLAAAAEAERLLARSDADWTATRPMMEADSDAVYTRLRERFIAGVSARPTLDDEQAQAEQLFAILHKTGGAAAIGGLDALPDGIFWAHPGGIG